MEVVIKQGKGGRWRWLAYSGNTYRAGGPPRGFEYAQGAYEDAVDVFGSRLVIRDETGHSVFAGERDLSD